MQTYAQPDPSRREADITSNSNRLGGTSTIVLTLVLCHAVLMACRGNDPSRTRESLRWSAWVEDAAAQRGYIKAGDFALFGCPPGWMGIDDTAAALRGRPVSTRYIGTDPPPHEGTITCVAQRDFALPAQSESAHARAEPLRRPVTPVWVSTEGDGITIGFARELPLSAAIYIGQDTPCGPRLIGVELGDLMKWLADPYSGPGRHFLGMISGGCPEQNRR